MKCATSFNLSESPALLSLFAMADLYISFFDQGLRSFKATSQLLRRFAQDPGPGQSLLLEQISACYSADSARFAALPCCGKGSFQLGRIFFRFLSRLYEFCEWEYTKSGVPQLQQYYGRLLRQISSVQKSSEQIRPFLEEYYRSTASLIFECSKRLGEGAARFSQYCGQDSPSESTETRARSRRGHDRVQGLFRTLSEVLLTQYSVMDIDRTHTRSCIDLSASLEDNKNRLIFELTQRNKSQSSMIQSFIRRIKRKHYKLGSQDRRSAKQAASFRERRVTTEVSGPLANNYLSECERMRTSLSRESKKNKSVYRNVQSRVYRVKTPAVLMEDIGLGTSQLPRRGREEQLFNFNLTQTEFPPRHERRTATRRAEGALQVSGRQINICQTKDRQRESRLSRFA